MNNSSQLINVLTVILLASTVCINIFAKAQQVSNETTMFYEFSNVSTNKHWYVTNDSVMGGISSGSISPYDDHVVFSGNISLENDGGFSSVYYPITPLNSTTSEVTFEVIGDGKTYQFRAVTNYQGYRLAYKHEFKTLHGVKKRVTLKLSDFVASFRGRELTNVPPINTENMQAFGFLINSKKEGPFKLAIFNVKFS